MTTLQADWIAYAQDAQRRTRVPAAVTLAQFGLESGWGQHMPPGSNNPFGIKAVAGAPSVTVMTSEFQGGRFVRVPQKFAVYTSLAQAFLAHAILLSTHEAYAPAMAKLPDVQAFVMFMGHVYATDPNYAQKLLQLIQADGLVQYDLLPPEVNVPVAPAPVLAPAPAPAVAIPAQTVAVPAAPAPAADLLEQLLPLIKQTIAEAQSQPQTVATILAEAKPWFTSKTVWGIGVAGVAAALQQLGYTFAAADQADLINTAMQWVQVGGLLLAIIGRVTATKALK